MALPLRKFREVKQSACIGDNADSEPFYYDLEAFPVLLQLLLLFMASDQTFEVQHKRLSVV